MVAADLGPAACPHGSISIAEELRRKLSEHSCAPMSEPSVTLDRPVVGYRAAEAVADRLTLGFTTVVLVDDSVKRADNIALSWELGGPDAVSGP